LASLHAAEAAAGNAQLEVDKLPRLVENKVVSDYQLKTAKAACRLPKPISNRLKQMYQPRKLI
jgi:membrane fusion protein (multidrug efflux system)